MTAIDKLLEKLDRIESEFVDIRDATLDAREEMEPQEAAFVVGKIVTMATQVSALCVMLRMRDMDDPNEVARLAVNGDKEAEAVVLGTLRSKIAIHNLIRDADG